MTMKTTKATTNAPTTAEVQLMLATSYFSEPTLLRGIITDTETDDSDDKMFEVHDLLLRNVPKHMHPQNGDGDDEHDQRNPSSRVHRLAKGL